MVALGIRYEQSMETELLPKSLGHTKQGHVLGSREVLDGVRSVEQTHPSARRKSNPMD